MINRYICGNYYLDIFGIIFVLEFIYKLIFSSTASDQLFLLKFVIFIFLYFFYTFELSFSFLYAFFFLNCFRTFIFLEFLYAFLFLVLLNFIFIWFTCIFLLAVLLNHPISFDCPVDGNPKPEIQWLINGLPVLASGKYMQLSATKAELHILR